MLYKTYHSKRTQEARNWHLFDAKEKVLGRLATEIARVLIGKHKKDYSPHQDAGDWAVVINSKDVKVTGKKETNKMYYRHSGYPGGFKKTTLGQLRQKNPNKIIEKAVKGMLPDNKLQAKRMGRLKVFAGEEHPYKDNVHFNSIINS